MSGDAINEIGEDIMKTVMPRMLICLWVFLAGSAWSTEAVITGAATARTAWIFTTKPWAVAHRRSLHGWNCDRRYWSDQLAYFRKHRLLRSISLATNRVCSAEVDDQSFGADVASVSISWRWMTLF